MRRSLPLFSLLLALLYLWLFHGERPGLNLLLFETIALGLLWALDRPRLNAVGGVAVAGTLVSAMAMAIHGSAFALWMNIVSAILLAGVLLAPRLNAMNHALLLGLAHVFPAQKAFLTGLNGGVAGRKIPGFHRRTLAGLLAVAGMAWLFSKLYQASNPHFEEFIAEAGITVSAWLDGVDLAMLGTFLVGLTVSNVILQRTRNEGLLQWVARSHDQLFRRRQRPSRIILGLRYELRTGVLLLGVLNLLLLVVNYFDVKHVWLGFTFNGQYLKQFVHEGTVLLILSILLGAGIVLYFFRANQNFHRGNGTLKMLAYVWLAQNAVLAASVGMRNFWYIQHYALAYKRIGVIFFLLACIIGLYLIHRKVRDRRSYHYLIRWNAFSAYVILLLMACVDWDVVIARYNFNARDHAFVHLDYLATLNEKALPWLEHDMEELVIMDRHNQKLLGAMGTFDRSLYMTPGSYAMVIADRKAAFLASYPGSSWKSWTWARARAYRLLEK